MATTKIGFSQINLQHCKSASAILARSMARLQTHIALIQEPWLYRGRIRGLTTSGDLFVGTSEGDARACICIKGINGLLLQELSSRDCTTVRIEYEDEEGRMKTVVISSAYLPHDEDAPTLVVKKVVEYCRRKNLDLIIGSDANAHHEAWGSTDINDRGAVLLEYINGTQMDIVNQGNEPTFITSNRREVLDLTLASMNIRGYIHGWKVEQEPSMSDHRTITFGIQCKKPKVEYKRNPKETNWETYTVELAERLRTLKGRYGTDEDLEHTLQEVCRALIGTYENNCSLKPGRQYNSTPWWNRTLEAKRLEVRKAFNRAKKKRTSEGWAVHKDAQRDFKRELEKAKAEKWQEFCSGMENLADTAKLARILTKDNSVRLRCLKDGTGRYMETEEDTLTLLLKASFPDFVREENPQPSDKRGQRSKADWVTAAQVVTPEKVKWAINSFEPYKTPGPDGIFPKMLQEGCKSILGFITGILRGCVAIGYVPNIWKQTRVSFIPKPGKKSYFTVKDFRPISLTSFLLKTLERLVDTYIRQNILINRPLHRRQHAYTVGKSTETALHSVVNYIEKAFEAKETVIGSFVDIEGAFNSTTRNSIENAMSKQGIPITIARWVTESLSDRCVLSEWNGKTVKGRVSEGCPQGGVLSPLLWIMVSDELLHVLEAERIHAAAYADDFVILVKGKYEEVLPDLMERALQKVRQWCGSKSLGVNPDKTEIVLFTRKYKSRVKKKISFYGKIIPYATGVKYLGVYLDKKLNWGQHLRLQGRKVLNIFMQCRSAIGTGWGLEPRHALWIYEAILIPKLTYAALVWWKETEKKTSRRSLDHIQAVVLRGIFGLKRSTPMAAIRMLLEINSLDLEVKTSAARAAYRLKCSNEWEGGGSGHSTIQNFLRGPVFDTPQDRITRTLQFGQRYKTRIPSREEWEDKLSPGHGEIWFTDGSKTGEGTGFGISAPRRRDDVACRLRPENTVFQAEMAAIEACSRQLVRAEVQDKCICICTDSQASIMALENPCTKSKLVQETKNALNELARFNKVVITWIPGHSGYRGNERADKLAKQGAKSGEHPERGVGIPYREGCNTITKEIIGKRWETWKGSQGHRWCKELMGDFISSWAKTIIKMGKRKARDALGILTGHCELRCYTHKTQGQSNLCRWCGEAEETPCHFLCKCPNLIVLRHRWLGAAILDPESFRETSIDNILAFCKSVGFSAHLSEVA